MQLIGYAIISSGDTDEPIVIRQAYIKGTKPVMSLRPDVIVAPKRATRAQVSTFVKPVIVADTEPLSARVILVDHKNRKYVTPTVTFHPASGPRQTKTSN